MRISTCTKAILLYLLLSGGHTIRAAEPAYNVILIGWDGADRNRIMQEISARKTPNLLALIKDGGLSKTKITTGRTMTKPGWAEILTGCDSTSMKILTNTEYRPIPPGYTVFEKLKKRYGNNIATLFISGKKYNTGIRGKHKVCVNAYSRDALTMAPAYAQDEALFKGKTLDDSAPLWEDREGEPYLNAAKALDYYWGGDAASDTTGRIMLSTLDKYGKKPFFAFFHFREPDEEGHLYGESTKEYSSAIEKNDYWLGEIVKQLRKSGVYDKTIILVTADHGMDLGQRTHKNAPFMTLAANSGLRLRDGDRKDIAATILALFSPDLFVRTASCPGKSLIIQ